MPKATVNGIETQYEVQGTGTPALFIHGGWGGPASSLVPLENAVTSALGDDVQLITYDRRCAGESQYVPDAFTVADIAADARALLKHLEIDRSVVIGHSMGGMVAQQYGLDYPDHVIGLCVAATGADLMSSIDLGRAGSELTERCRSEGDRAVFDSLKDQLRNPPVVATAEPRTPDAEQRLQRRNEAVAKALGEVPEDELFRYWVGMIRNYDAFIGHDFTPRLSGLAMPVLVVHGTGDTVVPFELGNALYEATPHSELCALDGAGHGVFDYPEGRSALRTWVQTVGARVPSP